jgi:hypothetical protein
MGCQCKVTKNINYIQQTYGANQIVRKKTNIRGMVSKGVSSVVVFILELPIIPIMFLINIFKSLTTSKINFSKLIRPLGNVRD